MKQRSWLASAFLAAILPVLIQPGASHELSGDRLVFWPADGLCLRKSFHLKAEQSADRMWTFVEGQERPSEVGTGSSEENKLVVVDEYLTFEDGRITKLERAYDIVEMTEAYSSDAFGGQLDFGFDAACLLVGETVLFRWEEESNKTIVISEDVRDEDLEALQMELDFTCLLPDGEVSQGDKWDIDAGSLMTAMSPWIGLPAVWQSSSDSGMEADDADEDLPELIETVFVSGEVTALYEGRRKVEEMEVAAITVRGQIVREVTTEMSYDGEEGLEYQRGVFVTTLRIEGKGLWDVVGDHLHSIELEAKTTEDMETEISSDGVEYLPSSGSELSGTWSLKVSFVRTK